MKRWLCVPLLLAISVSLASCQLSSQASNSHNPTPASSQTPRPNDAAITVFPTTLYGISGGLTAGADGNMWLATPVLIARLTPTGSYISSFAKGADHNLWFVASAQVAADTITNQIGRITFPT
ncbi:MAG: hypothetical protein ACRDHE_15775 [Ktedonobacterales bacterium]